MPKKITEEKVYPGLMQTHKGEWQAWQNLGAIINEIDPKAGRHNAGCKCEGVGCRLYNAIRAWGREVLGDDVADQRGL